MTKNEALAFTIMKEVITKNDMAILFNTETPMLKLDFYTLDRLISICLPDLHSHFKVSSNHLMKTCLIYRKKI